MLAQSVNENSVQEATSKVASFAFPASHRLHRERDINALCTGNKSFRFPLSCNLPAHAEREQRIANSDDAYCAQTPIQARRGSESE